eukprot:scaffold1654_cov258-Pinguiococcus_pyrenoidosus.AAC.1
MPLLRRRLDKTTAIQTSQPLRDISEATLDDLRHRGGTSAVVEMREVSERGVEDATLIAPHSSRPDHRVALPHGSPFVGAFIDAREDGDVRIVRGVPAQVEELILMVEACGKRPEADAQPGHFVLVHADSALLRCRM